MLKSDKQKVVESLANRIKDAKSVTVIDYQGMPSKELVQLRQKITKAGGTFNVAKNTLLKLAFEQNKEQTTKNIPTEGLTGPTAVIFATTDEIAPLQVLGKSIAELNLPKLKFGIFNSEILGMDKLLALSRLPSKNVLVGQLLGALVGPKYQFVQTLNGNLQKLVYILTEHKKARVEERESIRA